MRTTLGAIKSWLALLVAAFLLTGCLDGDDGGTGAAATSISGTAATGAAMTGTVDLVDANGVTRNVTIGANGAFSIDTTGLAAPMILRANGNGGAVTLFSLADGLTGVFNITPLTNLALEVLRQGDAEAQAYANLAAVFVDWHGLMDPADLAEVQGGLRDALAVVNANLRAQFEANGLDETSFDFLRAAFTPNGTGIDGVLDDIVVSFGEGGVVFNVGESQHNFNFSISIDGFNIGGGASGDGGGGGGTATCDAGATATTYSGNAAAPYTNGSSACFTATPTSLAFSGKTLSNPVSTSSGDYTIASFTDADTGYKYETVLVTASGALHEINLVSNASVFLGQFAPAVAGGGGGGAGSLSVTTSGSIQGINYSIPAITISPVSAPANQTEFCGGITNDASYQQVLNSVGAGGLATLTFNSCSYSGNVGTISMTISINSIVGQITGPYTITYTFN